MRQVRITATDGEPIGIVKDIRLFEATGYTELTIVVSPHYSGIKVIEKAAKEGRIVVHGLKPEDEKEARSPT